MDGRLDVLNIRITTLYANIELVTENPSVSQSLVPIPTVVSMNAFLLDLTYR